MDHEYKVLIEYFIMMLVPVKYLKLMAFHLSLSPFDGALMPQCIYKVFGTICSCSTKSCFSLLTHINPAFFIDIYLFYILSKYIVISLN